MAQDWGTWLEAAEHELREARGSLSAGSYQSAAFFSHQIAELALTAVLLHEGGVLPSPTHNLVSMANNLGAPPEVVHWARVLNPLYRGTRYPHLANGNPGRNYDATIAGRLLGTAEDMLSWCEARLPGRTGVLSSLNVL